MTRDRYKIKFRRQPHFVTCTIVQWIPVFKIEGMIDIVLDSIRYLQSKGEMILYGFVIMEDHLHLIVKADNLSIVLGRFKSFTARKIIDLLGERNDHAVLLNLRSAKSPYKKESEYQLWQEGFHPILIQNSEIMRQKMIYMHHNPVRKGYVEKPEDWEYSSARNYSGQEGVLEVIKSW